MIDKILIGLSFDKGYEADSFVKEFENITDGVMYYSSTHLVFIFSISTKENISLLVEKYKEKKYDMYIKSIYESRRDEIKEVLSVYTLEDLLSKKEFYNYILKGDNLEIENGNMTFSVDITNGMKLSSIIDLWDENGCYICSYNEMPNGEFKKFYHNGGYWT